jgi:hypothetical protein
MNLKPFELEDFRNIIAVPFIDFHITYTFAKSGTCTLLIPDTGNCSIYIFVTSKSLVTENKYEADFVRDTMTMSANLLMRLTENAGKHIR